MKTTNKFKSMLLVLAISFCAAGFVSCISTSDTGSLENSSSASIESSSTSSDGGSNNSSETSSNNSSENSSDNSSESSSDNSSENSSDNSSESSSDNSSETSSDTSEEVKEEYAVYFITGQKGYSIDKIVYEPGEAVTLPDCKDKQLGVYECEFLYWANALNDEKVETLTMTEGNIYLYAVYDNGMMSGDFDFSLTEEGYVAVDSTSHGALKNLSLSNDGDVYSLCLTLPANAADYSSECGLTFAAKSYKNHTFSNYLQLFIVNGTSTKAGTLYLYLIEPNKNDSSQTASTLLKEVTLSSLEGTAYYKKFNAWLANDKEETFEYTVRLNKTEQKWYIGVDGEELTYISVGDTKNGYTVTADYLSQSIIGFRAKNVNVKFAQPKVTNIGDYTFTLDANGGAFEDGAVEKTLKISAFDYANLPTPTYEGYSFRGWYGYDEKGAEISVTENTLSLASLLNLNATYYAKWASGDQGETYTISFDTGISGYEVSSINYYAPGDEVTLPTLSHKEYTFDASYYYDEARTKVVDFANFDINSANVSNGVITVYIKATYVFAGEGTENNPYKLQTANDLRLFAELVNGGKTYENTYFRITANIDLGSGTTWTPIEAGFAGTLDGGDFTVSNVNMNVTERKKGFFVELNAGVIKNLHLNVNITSNTDIVAGLVSTVSGNVTIENCSVSGSIKALKSAGGIVAYVNATTGATLTLKNCVNNATIQLTNTAKTTNVFTGGIIGATADKAGFTIDACTNNGEIKGTGIFIGGVAGLLRAASGSSVKNCYNYGNVTVGEGSTWIGGLIGCSRVAVSNCYCLRTAMITVGTESKAASEYAATSSAAATVAYLIGTSTGISPENSGLCDENGNAIA